MRSPRFLLVDDHEHIRNLLRRVLERRGFEVVGEAENGLVGVEIAALVQPEIVLMDINMPVINGIEATRQIKAANPTIEVLIFSAYDDDSLRRSAEEVGAAGWILKGSPPQELFDAIDRLIAAQAG